MGGCHSDLLMYKFAPKDLEFAFTLDHDPNSNCITQFTDPSGKVHKERTTPNSLYMLRPNGVVHCVSATSGGTRTILKWIFVGDYRKSDAFVHYKSNSCDDSQPNRKLLKERREAYQRKEL